MPDSFTTTSTQGFFSRLMGSFVGILLGPLFVIAAIVLLSWNEGRAVQAIRGLAEASGVVVEAPTDAAAPANEGKLIHVVGKAEATQAIPDSDLNLSFDGQVAVDRTVEMYAWSEKKEEKTQDNTGGSQTTTTTYTYTKGWTESPADSGSFAHPEGHENPQMPFASHKYTAGDAHLGGYTLDETTVGMIDAPTALNPTAPDGWTANGGNLFKGDNPATPAVGDVRVHYTGLPSGTTVSVLAGQSHDGFGPYTTSNGYTIHLAGAGNMPASEMIKQQQQAEAFLTWILRGAGAFVVFVGFAMFFGPISTLAAVLPFLGTIVRGATTFFAFVLTIPVTLVTIALSWLAFRPLIGGAMLIVAAGLGYALWRWHHSRSAAHVAATPAPAK